MSKTILVSNRLPLSIKLKDQGLQIQPSVGGLATGLMPLHDKEEGMWIGWTGMVEEEIPSDQTKDDIMEAALKEGCFPVSLTQEEIKAFYEGFSNRTIWPLFHYFTEYTVYDDSFWEVYQSVNRKYADEVLQYAENDDVIWVHDYQLMLVPRYIKEKNPNLTVGFFLHIPFPSYEVFRLLPYREEILKGLLGADLVGFHTDSYKEHFKETAASLLFCTVEGNRIHCEDSITETGCFPLGIDVQKFETVARERLHISKKQSTRLQRVLDSQQLEDIKLILSIDRLDYTKGIAHRIRAFDHFLSQHPEYLGKVRLVMLAVPSRTEVPQYQMLKKEVDELVGYVNGKYADISWTPIWYFYRSMPFTKLIDLYTRCDVALITPLRDGMNLVAKEYIAARAGNKGVLILSEMTGAACEMKDALLINPNNPDEISQALYEALEMPEEEQIERNTHLLERLKKQDVHSWTRQFIDTLETIRTEKKKSNVPQKISPFLLKQWKGLQEKAARCVFFLDYDGTLVDFKDRPEEAVPDDEILKLVQQLAREDKNEVVLISGRDRNTLEQWWQEAPITLIAEHGLCLRTKDGSWSSFDPPEIQQIKQFKPYFKEAVTLYPGSLLEEKPSSLVWHYRQLPEEAGEAAAKRFEAGLQAWGIPQGVEVMKGHKMIEILSAKHNKGKTAGRYLQNLKEPCLVFAIGDDVTDEAMFNELPAESITIKVGATETRARYYLDTVAEVRNFLKAIVTKASQSEKRKPKNQVA